MLWLALLFGCDPVVAETIAGTLLVGPYEGDGPVRGGTISIYDDAGRLFDSAPIGDGGRFEVTGPQGLPIVASIEGPGLVEAVFVGVLGIGRFDVEQGELYGWSTELMDDLRGRFGSCGAASGAVVAGEIRVFGAESPNGDPVVVTTGYASLADEDGNEYVPCYLDDEGAYDPGAGVTGETGEFAFFGLPAGDYTLRYGYEVAGIDVPAQLLITVRDEAILPMYPLFVDLLQ
jgi:hypothetical protein